MEKRQLHNIYVNNETGALIAISVGESPPQPYDQWWPCAITPGLMTEGEAVVWAMWWRSSRDVHQAADHAPVAEPATERNPAPVTVREVARQALHRVLVVASDGLVWLAARL